MKGTLTLSYEKARISAIIEMNSATFFAHGLPHSKKAIFKVTLNVEVCTAGVISAKDQHTSYLLSFES